MKKLFLVPLCFLFLLSFKVSAQIDLEKEILGVRDSSDIIVTDGRKQANDMLLKRDFANLIDVIDHTRSKSDRNKYVVFYPIEEQLFSLLAGNLDRFFSVAADFGAYTYTLEPEDDHLTVYAYSIIYEDKDSWAKWFDELSIDAEQKQTLRIFLGYIGVFDDLNKSRTQVKSFLRNNSKSEYYNYVSQYRSTFNTASYEFSLGGGVTKTYGEILKFVDPSGIFSMSIDYFLNRLYCGFIIFGTGGELLNYYYVQPRKEDAFMLSPGDDINETNVGGRIGWTILKKGRVRITPAIDISYHSISAISPNNNEEEESISINSTTGLGAGLLADVDLFHWYSYEDKISLGLRLSFDYQQFIAGKKSVDGSGWNSAASILLRFGN